MSAFIDEAEVFFRSGDGGSGAVAFHREKHVPRGGPNGADGGRGGDIVLLADQGRRTLLDFSIAKKFEAECGIHAIGNKKGKNGKSIELRVPVGTIITDLDTGDVLTDLNIHGMKFVLCKGGRGGHGNLHYVSSVRQVPNFAEKGEPGERRRVKMELKLLADVGLVGVPNAGKSSLLSQISAARPRIADYPFTTISPNLGVVRVVDESFVVADLPGLIEGASEGIGLGFQFLKHAERTKVLIHVVDAFPIDGSDPIENFNLIQRELRDYSASLGDRPMIIALNKIDLIPIGDFNDIRERFETLGLPLFPISAATGQGIPEMLFAVLEILLAAENNTTAEVTITIRPPEEADSWHITRLNDGFEVIGKKVQRAVAMTDLTNRDAVRYLHRRLTRMGVIEALREAGAHEGDTVYVGQSVFTYGENS